MNSNLAEEIEKEEIIEQSNHALDHSEHTPLRESHLEELSVPKGLGRLEIRLMTLIGFVLFGLLLLNVHTDLQLAMSSRNVQDLNNQIEVISVENENLSQHIQELSRYDRIHEIAQKHGLKLHEENIRNLSPLK